jgi:hypothetical protein
MSNQAESDSLNYFKLGTQYYLTGRFATFAGCLPVAGTLLHHALEMFLKGDLISHLSRDELKRVGHSLERLWSQYKQSKPSIDLARFDKLVAELHKFEDIRYPDRITDFGMYGTISIVKWSPGPSFWSADGNVPPGYHLVVSDLDEMVKAVFTASSVNPAFYSIRFLATGALSSIRTTRHFRPPN